MGTYEAALRALKSPALLADHRGRLSDEEQHDAMGAIDSLLQRYAFSRNQRNVLRFAVLEKGN